MVCKCRKKILSKNINKIKKMFIVLTRAPGISKKKFGSQQKFLVANKNLSPPPNFCNFLEYRN